MARFPNAIGYILELRNQENISWFSNICDHVISSNSSIMSQPQIDNLLNILFGINTYLPANIIQPPTQQTLQAAPTTPNPNWLENISNFQNFKNLSDSIELILDKRITIIYGMNGSGKSSLCEALKILSKPEIPVNPISNVRHTNNQPATSFEYKFHTDAANNLWTENSGFGLLSNRIKYFDSTVSLKLLTESAETEKIVEITPFRLELFIYIGDLVKQFRNSINQKVTLANSNITTQIEILKNNFNEYLNEYPAIRDLDVNNYVPLQTILTNHLPLSQNELTIKLELSNQLHRLNEASTVSGLRLQKNEFDSLLNFARTIKKAIKLVTKKSIKELFETNKSITELKSHKILLAKEIIPVNTNDEEFIKFIEASKPIFTYEDIDINSLCPFCRQKLNDSSIDLLNKYHQFLVDIVGQRIIENESLLSRDLVSLQELKRLSISSDSVNSISSLQLPITSLVSWHNKIQEILAKNISDYTEEDFTFYENNDVVKSDLEQLAKEILQRYRAIKYASSSSTELADRIANINTQLRSYNFRILFNDNIIAIRNMLTELNNLSTLEIHKTEANFPVILAKITNKGKEANRELVVSEFTRVLNQEYFSLSDRTLAQFGISINDRASEQTVFVNTNIGSQPLISILSEGEQKIHSLSLFFSELLISGHNIIVFDDPVNSFDYNYSNRFTERLRDYILSNPSKQFIILTHNWDFFVYIQSVLNRANLNNDIAVQVIEQCAIVKEYTEDVDRIKVLLNTKLAETGILSIEDKELLSGYLRRLIESIINKCVFNKQRHQFKQKTFNISTFDHFTKLVALTSAEAIQLRDLYSSLSVPEHDDPRNHYRNIDRITYQRWFSEIATIEANLENRRPT